MAKSESTSNDEIQFVNLSDETRRRYLNYALSVIQSRALPDVRDGLKPVQRRIMHVLYTDLRLMADSKPRKCAKIVGETIGNYHPHGDSAAYEALVRMAQDFSLREPLVDGQGNFGSVVGLPAAAARYTEARLTAIAERLMSEQRYNTVEMRDNYDGEKKEPVVLPAQFPNLLINGTQGIAVGMATNIPPHNLQECLKACVHLIENPDATIAQLMKFIKGPDFPMGGRIVTDRRDLRTVYETGRGAIKVRAEWKFVNGKGEGKKTIPQVIITSIPYATDTNAITAAIGEIAASRKIPQLIDSNDETNDRNGLRIVLEIKSESDAEAVMAYLYKHTNLEQNFNFNATCLVPDNEGTLVPRQLDLKEMLQHFLTFRFDVVTRRFQYLLEQLERRIHILEGFEIIFNGLDKALKLIRASSGKKDAAQKLIANFPLDELQANAILELQLYRISKLEIDDIRKELKEKQTEANRIRRILASDKKLWKVISDEFGELIDKFGTRRRSYIGSSEEIQEFDASAYIVKENTNVVITTDGWVKRVGKIQSVEKLRVREGDAVLQVVPASTLDHVVFCSSDGTAYTVPVDQIPASSGYGEPISKHIRLKDGVSIIEAFTTDNRFTYEAPLVKGAVDPESPPYLFITTANGQVTSIPFSQFRQASTKAGRRFCRLGAEDRVVDVHLLDDHQTAFLATRKSRILHFSLDEVPLLLNAGKGVRGIKLDKGDEVIGSVPLAKPGDSMQVINSNGNQQGYGQQKYTVTSRGGRGVKASQRVGFDYVMRPEIAIVDWSEIP